MLITIFPDTDPIYMYGCQTGDNTTSVINEVMTDKYLVDKNWRIIICRQRHIATAGMD